MTTDGIANRREPSIQSKPEAQQGAVKTATSLARAKIASVFMTATARFF
jgi:hypothetical protein